MLRSALLVVSICCVFIGAAPSLAGKLCEIDSESKIGSRVTFTGKIVYIAPPTKESLILSDGECETVVLFPPFWSITKQCRVDGTASVVAVIVKAGPDDLSLTNLQAISLACK